MISLGDDEEFIWKNSHKITIEYIRLPFVPCLFNFEDIPYVGFQ